MVDGAFVHEDDAVFGLLDRTTLHGDSVFTVLRAYGGRVFALEEHLGRLQQSARAIARVFPCSVGTLAAEVRACVAAVSALDVQVRVLLSRGVGPQGLSLRGVQGGSRVVVAQPYEAPAVIQYAQGIRAALVEWGVSGIMADLARAKTGNYLGRVMALHQAQARGFDEALLVDSQGLVWEASAANVFARLGDELVTPPLAGPILPGITRWHVLDIAREQGLKVSERELSSHALFEASEVFVTSSLREVMAISAVDEHIVGDGRAGTWAERLRESLRARAGAN